MFPIPMMLQAAIRWAESWTFGNGNRKQNIHHDVHMSTNKPFSYVQWLAFVQHASKSFDQRTQQVDESNKKQDSNSDTKKKEQEQTENTEKVRTTIQLSEHIDWSSCLMLKAEFEGIMRSLKTTSNVPGQRQQRRIMVTPSFISLALLNVAPSLWADSFFQDIVNVDKMMKSTSSNTVTELYVQRDCGLEDAVLARIMAEKEYGVRQRKENQALHDKKTTSSPGSTSIKVNPRLKVHLSRKCMKNLVQHASDSNRRTKYKFICRCVSRAPKHVVVDDVDSVFTGAHRHPLACLSCTTSAFVRYRAATSTLFKITPCEGSNRWSVIFGTEHRRMTEKIRLYTKEDIRCILLVLGLHNPSDLHPVIMSYDVDIWWSVVAHFGSVAQGLRDVFQKEVAQALVLSFY